MINLRLLFFRCEEYKMLKGIFEGILSILATVPPNFLVPNYANKLEEDWYAVAPGRVVGFFDIHAATLNYPQMIG